MHLAYDCGVAFHPKESTIPLAFNPEPPNLNPKAPSPNPKGSKPKTENLQTLNPKLLYNPQSQIGSNSPPRFQIPYHLEATVSDPGRSEGREAPSTLNPA